MALICNFIFIFRCTTLSFSLSTKQKLKIDLVTLFPSLVISGEPKLSESLNEILSLFTTAYFISVLQSVHGLNHRQVIELLLSRQSVLRLTTIELSQTTIKRGGRKRSTSISKRIGKRPSFRHHKRTVSNQSSTGAEERTRKSSIIRRFSVKRSTSPRSIRRANSLKRTSSNVERGTSGSRRLHSSMIVSSSQSSSPSSSPGGSGTQISRPGEKFFL